MAVTIIKSITLQPGEPFILPPGATVLGASDVDVLDSVCVDLDDLESLSCYVVIVGSWAENTGITDTGFWEGSGEGHQIMGLEVGDTQYLLGSPIQSVPGNTTGRFDMVTTVPNAIKALFPAIVDANGATLNESSPGDLGISIGYLQVRTFPSIGDKLKLIVKSKADAVLSGSNREVTAYLKFMTYDAAVTAGYVGLPDTLCEEE